MYSLHHAVISLLASIGLVFVLPPVVVAEQAVSPIVLILYGTAVGVLIDLDHFLIARIRTGSWAAVRFCLANPRAVAFDQGRIFGWGDVGVLHRLLSHLLIAGGVASLLALESPSLALLTGVVLYIHLVCDLVWDIFG